MQVGFVRIKMKMQRQVPLFVKGMIGILLLAPTIPSTSSADTNDSLAYLIRSAKADTTRVNAMLDLSGAMIRTNIDSSWQLLVQAKRIIDEKHLFGLYPHYYTVQGAYCWLTGDLEKALVQFKKGRSLAKQLGDIEYQAKTASNIGALWGIFGSPDSASFYLEESLALAKQLHAEKLSSKIAYDLGGVYQRIGRNELALRNLLSVLRYQIAKQDSFHMIYTLNSLGTTYKNLQDFEKARDYYVQAEALDRRIGTGEVLSEIYNNLGVLYTDVAGNPNKARKYLLQSIECLPKKPTPGVKEAILLNLANVSILDGKWLEAMGTIRQVLTGLRGDLNPFAVAAAHVTLGQINYRLHRFDSSRTHLVQGLKIAESISALEWEMRAHHGLFLVDSTSGKLLSAIRHLQLYHMRKDSISNSQTEQKIAEAEILSALDQKEHENQLLNRKNELANKVIEQQRSFIILAVLAILSIAVLLIFSIRNYVRLRTINREMERKTVEILTQQKDMELLNQALENQKQSLEEVNKAKDKFFSILSHDLKSPFNSILGTLDLLSTNYYELDDSTKLSFIGSLLKSSQNAYNLVENLLTWSRSQRGLLSNNPCVLFLRNAVSQALEVVSHHAERKELMLVNEMGEEIQAWCDPKLLQSVFLNLLNNAIKFTPRGGTITLRTVVSSAFIEITIEDTGIGIPTDKLLSIFHLGSEMQRSGTEKETGTGLGLVICKEFVELMGGEISVHSVEGSGSRFAFTLPLPADTNAQ